MKNNLFVRSALNAVREARGEAPLDAFDFLADARATAGAWACRAMLDRPVNDGFSGGERKRNELLQLALLRRAWPCSTRSTRAWTWTAHAPWSSWCASGARRRAFIVVTLPAVDRAAAPMRCCARPKAALPRWRLALAADIARRGFAREAAAQEA